MKTSLTQTLSITQRLVHICCGCCIAMGSLGLCVTSSIAWAGCMANHHHNHPRTTDAMLSYAMHNNNHLGMYLFVGIEVFVLLYSTSIDRPSTDPLTRTLLPLHSRYVLACGALADLLFGCPVPCHTLTDARGTGCAAYSITCGYCLGGAPWYGVCVCVLLHMRCTYTWCSPKLFMTHNQVPMSWQVSV